MALHFGIVLLVMVKSALSAIDAGVTVFGTTVAPNFKRQEGRGTRNILYKGQNEFSTSLVP